MNLCIDFYTYPENVDKDKVMRELRDIVQHLEHSISELYEIKWIENEPFDSIESAKDFINKNDVHSCIAVRYRNLPEDAKMSSKYKNLLAMYQKAEVRYHSLREKKYIRTVNTKFIRCRFCGSRFNRVQMLNHTYTWPINLCPICYNDFRPETTLKSLEKAAKRVSDLKTQIQAEKDRLAKEHGEIRWLVKISFVL